MSNIEYTIFEERFSWAINLIEKYTKEKGYTLSDMEKMELATRISQTLFIQKEKRNN